jgi:molybdate transport repressor ModE-like protein
MEPDYRQLMYLLAIAECGSFSRAAAKLWMSQPALSNSIAALEQRLKAKLLTRGRSGAALTDTGEVLVRHARILQTQMGRAVEEMDLLQQASFGPLVVGVTPVAAASLVPRALAQLRRQMPSLAVRVHETVFKEGMDGLLNGSLDLMVGPIGVYPPVDGIEEQRLTVDPFTLVMRKGHPLSKRRSVSLRQLTDVEWVLPSDHSAFHKQLESLFVVAGLGWPKNAITTNSMTAIKSIAIHSDCVALMPKQLVELERKTGMLATVRLQEGGVSRALGISWAKDRTPSTAAEAFVRILHDCTRAERRAVPTGNAAQPNLPAVPATCP